MPDSLAPLLLLVVSVAGLVWVIDDLGYDPEPLRWWAWLLTVFAGLTMVSNFKYWSFKAFNLKKSVPFVVIFLVVMFVVLLSLQPPIVLFAGFVAYAISGYAVSAWSALKKRRPV